MKIGVVIFPGTNCERETLAAARRIMGWEAVVCPHREPLSGDLDLVILPGGFSYGDYLRAGSLAAFSPAMADVRRFADRGGRVLGICNGFQALCEAGLLPGALRLNRGLQFRCEDARLRVERRDTPFTRACPRTLRLPIAHREGAYFADVATLARLERERRVLLRYVDEAGEASDAANPNGSANNIAGIVNARGNVCGMMPHPERACEAIQGGEDGRAIFESLAADMAGV